MVTAVSLASLSRSSIKEYRGNPYCKLARRFRALSSLDVVICSDGLLVHAPVFWKEHRAFHLLLSDVGDEVLKGFCSCFSLQTKEHRPDLAVRQERKGYKLSDVPIHRIVLRICSLQGEFLHLKINMDKYISNLVRMSTGRWRTETLAKRPVTLLLQKRLSNGL